MNPTDLLYVPLWGPVIQFGGALLISGHVVAALVALVRGRGIRVARLLVAQGAITALSFTVAGTLLATLALRSWRQIFVFAAIFAFRTVLKRVFVWEQGHLSAPSATSSRSLG